MDIWITIAAIVSLSIGLNYLYLRLRKDGTLRIDRSNPEKDVYRFDVYDLESLSKKKYIIIRVDNKADLSHE